jgi:GAF domain-containing protein
MAEDLNIVSGSKQEKYISITAQIKALIDGEPDLTANLANIAAALKEQFGWFWVGFYMVKSNETKGVDELVLGPFQGPVACTRIQRGRGVCGSAWEKSITLIVPDVSKFPGHIACSSLSKSEIVIPIKHKGNILGVLDVDSDSLNAFDQIDKLYLEKILGLIEWSY